MNAVVARPLVSTEELLAMPRNGMERYLLRGQLREKPRTVRGRPHTRTLSFVVFELMKWRATQSEPRGEILSGDAGFRILRDPDTTVGIDIAYISAELAAGTPANARLIDGPPILAVEILSPSNNWDEVSEKVRSYLEARVPLVWVIDPVLRTVTVYRPSGEHQLFNEHQELTGDPHLPGFSVAVARLFAG